MSRSVSVVRDASGLTDALSTLTALRGVSTSLPNSSHTWETENMLLSARAIAQAALFREESRGAHFRSDFPDTDAALDGMHLVHDGRRGGWRLTTLPDALGRSEPAEVGR